MTKHERNVMTLRFVAAVLTVLVALAILTDKASADTGFLVDEYTKGSMRYCVYDTPKGEVILTVDYADLCPLSLEF